MATSLSTVALWREIIIFDRSFLKGDNSGPGCVLINLDCRNLMSISIMMTSTDGTRPFVTVAKVSAMAKTIGSTVNAPNVEK